MSRTPDVVDIRVTGGFSLYLLHPLTEAGKDWLEQHLDTSELVRWGSAVPVEPRFIEGIVEGAAADGLRVR